jgi:hypothetical protein
MKSNLRENNYRFGAGPKCAVDEDGAGGGQSHAAADRAEPCSSSSKTRSSVAIFPSVPFLTCYDSEKYQS